MSDLLALECEELDPKARPIEREAADAEPDTVAVSDRVACFRATLKGIARKWPRSRSALAAAGFLFATYGEKALRALPYEWCADWPPAERVAELLERAGLTQPDNPALPGQTLIPGVNAL